MGAKEIAADASLMTAWFLVRETGRYVWQNPGNTIASIYIVERFGWAGVRFLGRTGLVILRSQIRLGIDIGRVAVAELGPAAIPQRLAAPFTRAASGAASGAARAAPIVSRGALSAGRVAGWAVRASPQGAAVGAVVLLAMAPEMTYDLLSDPNSSAYVTDEETGEVTPIFPGITDGFR